MKLFALAKKEILLLIKNWQSYFLSLLVPVIAVLVNIVMTNSSVTTINVGVVKNEFNIKEFIQSNLTDSEQLTFKAINFESLEEALNELKTKKISSVVGLSDNRNITIYHDANRQDSQIATQYLINSFQTYISNDLTRNYPQEVNDLLIKQKYIIQNVQNISESLEPNKGNVNTMVLFGLMWIFIYFPLNLSISQIQSEKSSGTIYYLFKLKMFKIFILFAKQIAIIIQCMLSAAILLLIVKLTGIYNYNFQLIHIPLAVLLIMSMSSVGYFFGFILSDVGSSTIVTLFLTLPTMLVNSLNTTTSLDKIIRLIPSYYTGQIMHSILSGENININYIIIICAFIVLFYFLSLLIFSRREPIKLCKIS